MRQSLKKHDLLEKELYGYHVVLTIHNSRTSPRMITHGVQKGASLLLTLPEEIFLTEIIGKIIVENSCKCIAYNICRDHIHLLIVCPEGQLSRIIQKLKSISSKRFHQSGKIISYQPSDHHGHLWSQKFFRANLEEWTLARLSTQPGEVY